MTSIVLTAEQRRHAERRRKATLDRRIYERLTAVLAVAAGRTQEDVARLLGIDPSRLNEWLLLFRGEGLEALCTLAGREPPPYND
jgi:transcriptional regulator with XRE-family HTH domain